MISHSRWLDVALLAIVSALILSFVWDWQPSFRGAQVVFAIALIGALVCGSCPQWRVIARCGLSPGQLHARSSAAPACRGLVIISVTIMGHLLHSTRFPGAADAVVSLLQAVAFGLAQQ
jgi:hypothetical protein